MATSPILPLTEEQYLAIERNAQTRSEFHAGQMFAMAGGSFAHSLLGSRIGALLDTRVRESCHVFNSDMRIFIAAAGIYTYADCGVVCGKPEFQGGNDVLLNPVLIVEVLSPSTEAYDRGKKFEAYQKLQSLREYILIHQDRRRGEHFSRQDDGSWTLRILEDGSSLGIDRLGVTIGLDEIYARIV